MVSGDPFLDFKTGNRIGHLISEYFGIFWWAINNKPAQIQELKRIQCYLIVFLRTRKESNPQPPDP